jgi:hypothetical protein
VIDEVVDVGEALTTVQVQIGQRHLAWIDIEAGTSPPGAAILPAMDMKAV